jgi:hypothetical protein
MRQNEIYSYSRFRVDSRRLKVDSSWAAEMLATLSWLPNNRSRLYCWASCEFHRYCWYSELRFESASLSDQQFLRNGPLADEDFIGGFDIATKHCGNTN